jgi:hypothetical protein
MSLLRRYLPTLTWGREYSSRKFINDLIVAGSPRRPGAKGPAEGGSKH